MPAPILASSIAVLPLPLSVSDHAVMIPASNYVLGDKIFSLESASRCEELIAPHFKSKPYMAVVLANVDDVIRLGQNGTIFLADSKSALMRAALRFDLLGAEVVWVEPESEGQRGLLKECEYPELADYRELLKYHEHWRDADEAYYQCHLKAVGGGQWQLRGMPAIKGRAWKSPSAPAIRNFNLSQREVEDIFLAHIYDWLQSGNEDGENGIGLTIDDPVTGYTFLTEMWRCLVEGMGRLFQSHYRARS
ncbi:hypothetical protein [Azotobacter armeniacus]